MTDNLQKAPGKVKIWWMAVRPFAFPASVIPVLYGSLLSVVLNPGLKFNFVLFFITLIGCVLVHIGANLVNDIFDFKKGIDKADEEIGIPHGGSLVLSKGLMSPSEMKVGAFISLFIASIIAVYLYTQIGTPILYLSIFGLFSAIFYTATPLSLKYKALGDVQVFLNFGVGMTLGSYIVQTKVFDWVPAILSIPFGLLIIAILHSNNIRDVKFDGTFGVKTLPILVGEKYAKYFYYFFVLGAYASIIFFVAFGLLPWFALLNFISFPTAWKLIKMLNHVPSETMPAFEFGTKHNIMTAQLNTQFGVTLMLGLLIARYIIH
jgi:1,4-dihydroxy-2-naphthoate octaprenyltransferase